jgi:CRP-like cAMP-binding protein
MAGLKLRKNQKVEMLRGVNLFSRCSNAELGRAASLTTEYTASPGEVLTRRGERGLEFFVIIEGTATASRNDVVLATMGPGSFFGELAILDGGLRTATVTADTEMQLLLLSRKEFTALLRLAPEFALKIIDELASRMRKTDELLDPSPAVDKKVGPWSL